MGKRTDDIGERAAETPTALNPIIGLNHSEMVKSLSAVIGQALRQPAPFTKHFVRYSKDIVSILQGQSDIAPDAKDRRFQDPTWQKNPLYKYSLQSWMTLRKGLDGWVEDSAIDEADKSRAKFLVSVITDSMAPTNSLIGNPAAMKRIYETGGDSFINGLKNAYADIRYNNGMPSQVDKSQFRVGKNLATTPGKVVFRNELLELIQYKPASESVFTTPILSVPPQINKFYSFDLSPDKSLFRYLVDQGFQLFAISGRNPGIQQAHWGLAEYVEALIDAADAILAITRQKKLNITAACSGGITAASFASEISACRKDILNSLSLQVCLLDPQKEDSEISLFLSDDLIEYARLRSRKKGVLSGSELARTFAWLRPNDLIWNYVVNNYLLGDTPPAFDILYWNNDTTNLPAQLHSDYLDMYLDRRFANPGTVEFMGHAVDLTQVTQDVFIVAGVTDHITPWRACYRSVGLFGGDVEFVLANSGHLQALINPPGNPKASFFTNDHLPHVTDEWLGGATRQDGSWWPHWAAWLSERSGQKKNAPRSMGNKAHPPICDAPGEYVFG